MAEQLHTIPISDAMENAGECPFCYIERRVENHSMDYVLGHGASYMEADIRDMTDRQGFCRAHFKKIKQTLYICARPPASRRKGGRRGEKRI